VGKEHFNKIKVDGKKELNVTISRICFKEKQWNKSLAPPYIFRRML